MPEERLGKMLRCPRCRQEFLATADAQVATITKAAASAEAVCPICQTKIQSGEITLSCPECQQTHHRECWAEVGGCSTYGCPQAPVAAKPQEEQQPRSAWGDTKVCPACGETIKAIALRCRYCDTDFDTVDPLTRKDLRRRARKQKAVKSLQTGVTAMFIASLFGCLAPIMLLVNLIWFLPRRVEVSRAGPLFAVLGYVSLAISAVYTVLMVVFLVITLMG